MRIGVLSATMPSGDITGTIVSGGAGSAPPVTTYGVDASGNTLVCPPGYPYDPGIQDCLGYIGSPGDVARLQLQADIDACTSGGGIWSNGQCAMPTVSTPPVQTQAPAPAPVASQLIAGISNSVLYAAGGLLLLMIFMKGRR